MSFQLKYDPKIAGKKAVSTTDAAQLFTDFRNSGTVYNQAAGTSAGVCTGMYYQDGGVLYLQLENGNYAVVDYNAANAPQWNVSEAATAIMQYSTAQAQALVNKIIRNNITILCNNLLCARYADRLSQSEKSSVRALQERLQARNKALQAEGLTKDVETNYPAGYAELSAYLEQLMAGGGVGIAISTVAWIVVAAIVIAGAGTAAYYVYKVFADESERDVKFSKELTRTLVSKLTPEEYEQLKQETQGIVTKARIKQSLSSYGNVLTIAAFAFAGYYGYKLIKNRLRS